MSRLIDADKLLNELISITPYGMGEVGIKAVDDLIKSQPTAYDVDAVLEELEARAVCYNSTTLCLGSWDKCEYCNYCAINHKEAIDTVKRGGKK